MLAVRSRGTILSCEIEISYVLLYPLLNNDGLSNAISYTKFTNDTFSTCVVDADGELKPYSNLFDARITIKFLTTESLKRTSLNS